MSVETKALIAKLIKVRDHLKNCGTGAGGFQRGNSCGRTGGSGNSAEGSARRHAAGKRRKQRGPQTGVGAASRRARRRRAGRKNASRRKWKERIDRTGSKNEQILYKRQAAERKDLADVIKSERKEARADEKTARKDLSKELKAERRETRKDQSKERTKLKKDQEREVAKETRDFDKREASLDAKYEAAKPKAKDPDALDENYRERKQDLATERDERMRDLADEHWQARKDLRESHKNDRETQRAEHQGRAEDLRDDQRKARFNDHLSHKEQAYDLNESHRAERAEELRDLRLPDDDKSLDDLSTKAVDDASTPTAESILATALEATGHADAWEAGTLTDEQSREVLNSLVDQGRAWFRAEAEALLDDIGAGEKALFGAARAKVGAFFDRAKKHVRELFTAAVLAVTGPGPLNNQDAILQAAQQQVAEQIEYLDNFQQQVVSEAKPINQTVASRAEQYGASVWAGALSVHHEWQVATGKVTEVRRRLGPTEQHCKECPRLAKLGWVKIKDAVRLKVVPLGKQPCRVNCRCWLEMR